jgi:hypothetical protein
MGSAQSIFTLTGNPHLSLRGALATKSNAPMQGIASSQALLAMTGGPAIPVSMNARKYNSGLYTNRPND